MIFIDRNLVTIPKILENGSVKSKKELKEVIEHFTGLDKLKTYKKFKVYRDSSVKKKLIKMGKGKCAYCESTFLKTYVGDIEHFRPKGEIEELKASGDSKPGYYWLAASWDNLLLSCRNCNQKSKQSTLNVEEAKSMGKMNQFPLFDEAKRARSHDTDLKEEEKVRLLLNPCKENPEDYFKYYINSGVMKPRKRKKFLKQRALSSIKVFALQRVLLVQEREKKAILISAQMQRVEEALFNFNDFINDPIRSKRFSEVLQRELVVIQDFLKPEEEYLGLARQMIGMFLKKNFQIDINAA
ncbi:hypothetical protein IMCC3317_02560 [Kordia antarctica]|uniref:HNH nuclease domain-containing protein n=1 Tax=Kordia antarctica TaxID=1218801 RepID=A0A7L4ZEM5_9FLAO|nr:retron system putative HNH endonuclease [Kordia antarctica]QHI34911.1 hypothetical protein IMCC3317_02560 [Kordia antarctica]